MTINILHDRKINIAIGRSRKEVSWKNKEMLWSDFVKRLSENHRTAETFAEYMAAKKNRRDEIKDIGAFVGGYLTNGRRKAGNVQDRSLLTLDADFPPPELWDIFMMMIGCAAAMYSTHSHAPDKPRFRLVILLSRDILPDEYEPIARKIAELIGISYFDDTTYQPERLMYWWSTAKDGEAVFEYNDAAPLDPDKILSMYRNWKDTSEWPVSSRQHDIIKRELKKQENPTDKPGVIGAFCRAYNIHEAIEHFLSDYYEESATAGRYTYKNGSTSAGLVTYNDVFAYSHHGTDPSSGKLCNAFDLVRLHLFGLKDEDSAAKGNALPSYQAMIDLAVGDPGVKKLLAAEKLQSAKEDFVDIEGADNADTEWMAELEADRKGRYLSTVFNAKHILENDSRIKNRIALNLFSRKPNVLKPLPWDKKGFKDPREWDDSDQAILENYLSLAPYELNISSNKVKNILEEIKLKNAYHPVRNYLEGIRWDGAERADTLFIDYLGVEDSEYTRAVTRKMLIAAVKRVFEPGCKFDNVVTLVGKGGIGKSTIYRKLGKKWFSDTFNFKMLTMGGKQAYEQLQGYWITEIPEMTGLRKADDEAIKSFLASSSDNYRASFGRETVQRVRQGIFVGTSNDDEFIRSGRADRRWWPLGCMAQAPVKSIWKDLTEAEIDQIWAEAVAIYRTGEQPFLSEKMEAVAAEMRKGFMESEPFEEVIKDYLEKLLPTNWNDLNIYQRREFLMLKEESSIYPAGTIQRDRVSIKEIWEEAIQGRFDQISNEARGKIKAVMDNMEGWEKPNKTLWINGHASKGWIRTNLLRFISKKISN